MDNFSSENNLAISYYLLYHSNSRSLNPFASGKSQRNFAQPTQDQTIDELWEEYEWTEGDEQEVGMSLEKSSDRCRIDSVPSYHAPPDDVAWNEFYSRHQTNFFKDRHYLHTAFPNEFGPSGTRRVLVEVGCGVGNALLPLLEEKEAEGGENAWIVYGMDLSSVAIGLLKKDERFSSASNDGRAHAFVANIVECVPMECIQVADVSSLLFCLSAIDPAEHSRAVCNVANTLKPGGTIVFRDYGRFDESQVKLGSQRSKLIKDNFYVKHDATKCYFFTTHDLRRLFDQDAGLEIVELYYIRRMYKNRSTNKTRRRVWVHGCFRKPIS